MNPVATESKIAHTIVIKDNGPGIPEADINKKFQPFIHLEVSRNKKMAALAWSLQLRAQLSVIMMAMLLPEANQKAVKK